MRIKKLPQLLALHLKRFKYAEQISRNTKLSYRVLFPMELRLPNVVRNTYWLDTMPKYKYEITKPTNNPKPQFSLMNMRKNCLYLYN